MAVRNVPRLALSALEWVCYKQLLLGLPHAEKLAFHRPFCYTWSTSALSQLPMPLPSTGSRIGEVFEHQSQTHDLLLR